MPLSAVAGFAGLALVLIAAPGLDWAFILATASRHRSLSAAVAGLVGGYLLLSVVVAFGVGVPISRSPGVLTGLTLVGAAYLAYVGVNGLRRPGEVRPATGRAQSSRRGVLLQGLAVSGFNPKALLIFVALLPQFTAPARTWPVPAQMLVLGMVFAGLVGVFYTGLGKLATRLATRPAVGRWLSRTASVAMILLATLLVVDRLFTLSR